MGGIEEEKSGGAGGRAGGADKAKDGEGVSAAAAVPKEIHEVPVYVLLVLLVFQQVLRAFTRI